ncbi:ribonuclease H-like domain-containing protein [Tanacetum coccineum]
MDIQDGGEECVMSTQEYIKKVVEDVCEDEDFKPGCLRDIKNFLKIGKLDQVTAIVKSCTPNVLGDLTVSLIDLSSTIAGSIHHRVIDEGGYGKDINVGAALILANVFHKDTISGSGSGVGGSGMLDEEEIMKSLEEEEMVELDLQVCGNVTDQED